MVMVHDGGGGGGRQVLMLLDEIEAIARQTMGAMQSDAKAQTSTFRNGNLAPGAFNGLEQGLEFQAQEQAAQQVFAATIEKVMTDLETFGQTLMANVANFRQVDQSNADTITAMQADEQAATSVMDNVNQEYSAPDHTFASQETFEDQVTGNEALDVEQDESTQVPLDGGVDPEVDADRGDGSRGDGQGEGVSFE